MNGFALSGAIRAKGSPKGGALGRNRKFIVLPRPLPLGEVALRKQ